MEINLKPFESGWFRTLGGQLAFATNVGKCREPYSLVGAAVGASGRYIQTWMEDGISTSSREQMFDDLVEHLPDCTGWDWKPKSRLHVIAEQLREIGYTVNIRAARDLSDIATELESMEADRG